MEQNEYRTMRWETIVGIVLVVVGFAFVLLGWSAPVEFCTVAQGETDCTTNTSGIVQFVSFIIVGILIMMVGFGKIPPKSSATKKIIKKLH